MPAAMGSSSTIGRVRLLLIATAALAAVILFSAFAPPAAHAAGCENSWTNSSGGSWFESTNWSKKSIPLASEEVCITLPGSYTVTAYGPAVSVKSLTLGGASGTQLLSVGSLSNVGDQTLTTSSGLTVEPHGAVALTNADGAGYPVSLLGPVTNSGSITTEKGAGGARRLQGNVLNKGTLQINTSTNFNGEKAALLSVWG